MRTSLLEGAFHGGGRTINIVSPYTTSVVLSQNGTGLMRDTEGGKRSGNMRESVLNSLVKLLAPVLVASFAYYALRSWYYRRTSIVARENLLESYDYVIIGGGTAGCVVATRLSEIENATVLLLEAGYDDLDFPMTQWVPSEQGLQKSDFDWKFKTVPQEKCCDGYQNRLIKWPRGKGLGGCSSHNGGAFVRGSRYNYDRWGDGWTFEDVLPYFKKLESVRWAELSGRTDVHGYEGPMPVTEPGDSAFAETLIEAASATLGYPWRDDLNDATGKDQQEGFGKFPRNQLGGRRMGTAEAYLRPAASQRQDRLHVLTHAHVTKILFDRGNDRPVVATGVEFIHGGMKRSAKADVEVILSAGSVNSPQILMLSGIGPKEELNKHRIPIVVENEAVARNLYDHPIVPIAATVNDSTICFKGVDHDDWVESNLAKLQYYLLGAGPLADSAIRYTGFIRSGLTDDVWPDLQFFIVSGAVFSPVDVFNLNEKGAEALYTSDEWKGAAAGRRKPVGMTAVLLQPHNSGEIRLRSADPFDYPLIDPKYLHNNLDAEILAKGLNVTVQMLTSEEMRRYDTKLSGKHAPGCEQHKLWSDDYIKCYVRSMMSTVYHPVSTCRMGKEGKNSVVDTNLRVHGVDRLRIIDASVFPYQVSTNTNAPTIMVAEKGSTMIKSDYPANLKKKNKGG